MKVYKTPLFIIFLFSYSLLFSQEKNQMSNQKMDEIFKKEAQEIEGELGYWTMLYGEKPVIAITDSTANRMRLFTPIIEEEKLEKGQMKIMLEANFHSALDAKYCLYNDFVISVFTHPLKELTEEQLIDALRQVVILAYAFGDTYSSTGMIFGGGFQDGQAPKINKSPPKEEKS